MGKSFHTVIKKVATSWWLRGHLFILVIIGLAVYNIDTTQATIQKHKGVIAIDGTISTIRSVPTRVGTIIVKPSATVRPTAKPTIVPTKNPITIPTATPIVNSVNSGWPHCYYVITQYYGQNGEQGDDFGCDFHTRLTALWGGVVQYAGRTCWNSSCSSSSGGVIVIRSYVSGLGYESTYYLHIDAIAPGIRIGSYVPKGTYIALSGGQLYGGQWPASPMFSEGPHLEIGFNAWFLCESVVQCSGVHVNPLSYIEGAEYE